MTASSPTQTGTVRPLSKRQRKELEGYIHWSTELFRAFAFLFVLGIIGVLAKAAHIALVQLFPALSHDAFWLVPVALLGYKWFRLFNRGTGGRDFRASIRRDLSDGVLSVQRIVARDAIEAPEAEDEGPTYFVLIEDGRTLVLSGQYLYPYQKRGFPWTEFEILEAPHSKTFFGLRKIGEKLPPSLRRDPLSWEEFKRYEAKGASSNYRFLDVDFQSLKESWASA